jgi:hypothetical protein
VIDSIHTGLSVDEVHDSHNQQTHGDRDKVEDGKDGVDACRCETVLPVYGGVNAENYDGSEDWQHIHDHFDVGTIDERFETQLNLFRSNILDLVGNQLLPTVVFDDANT